MQTYRAELHVHTVLSPCAAIEMIPPLIVEQALQLGIHLLAITDHNASANASAVIQAARGTPLHILPGMELQTREETHLLCLFDTLDQLNTWQTIVDNHLPNIPNNIDYFGEQFIVDHQGEFIRRENRLLLNSVNLTLQQATAHINNLGGLPIPAHVDRKANGLIETLGLIPPGFEALEISRHLSPESARLKYPQLKDYPLIQSGDVHHIDDFLGSTFLTLTAPTIPEIRLALTSQNGRSLRVTH